MRVRHERKREEPSSTTSVTPTTVITESAPVTALPVEMEPVPPLVNEQLGTAPSGGTAEPEATIVGVPEVVSGFEIKQDGTDKVTIGPAPQGAGAGKDTSGPAVIVLKRDDGREVVLTVATSKREEDKPEVKEDVKSESDPTGTGAAGGVEAEPADATAGPTVTDNVSV